MRSAESCDLDPGSGLCPRHYEYVEEWLLVVRGELTVREPAGLRALGAGDLVRYPSGPDGAHKAMNRGDAPVRVLGGLEPGRLTGTLW